MVLLFIYYRGFRLKLRVSDLVETAAHKIGLERVIGQPRASAPPAADQSAEPSPGAGDETTGTAAVSPQGTI